MHWIDQKWDKYTPRERWHLMLGKDAGPVVWTCRACWFLFALWTMSMVGTGVYIAPGFWLLFVAIYYFYPCD